LDELKDFDMLINAKKNMQSWLQNTSTSKLQ